VSHRIALALETTINNLGHEAKIIDLLKLKLPRFQERYPKVKEKPGGWIGTMDTLKASDGIIFLTPEYNGSFSSGMKNFIDVFAKEPFRGKPIGVATGSSGSMGGIRAAYQLQQVVLSLFAYPLPQMLTVGRMQNRLDEKGVVIDGDFKTQLESYISSFLEFCAMFSDG
jgi:NAD(P)H-dependent FMN reductase